MQVPYGEGVASRAGPEGIRGSGLLIDVCVPGWVRSRPALPRRLRIDVGGIVYHVLNRRVGRLAIFENDLDYAALPHQPQGDFPSPSPLRLRRSSRYTVTR